MNEFETKLEERISQMKDWAAENGNIISHTVLLDMLKDERSPLDVDDDLVNRIKYELTAAGISVEPLEYSEGYSDESTEPDKFITAEININQKTLNVYNLMERLENNEIDLQPAFQRKGGLWDYVRQSRLIESLMLRIPIPTFYFDASNDDKWKVIDGLQRLTAFQNYLVGEEKEQGEGRKKKKLVGLQYLPEFNDMTIDDLPRQYMRRIKEAPIIAFSVEKGTPDMVVFNIFQRINTGGLRLEPQEIRNALYPGAAIELTQRLAEQKDFLEATQYAVSPDRMLDREYVNRFIAFTELNYEVEYKDDIDAFLIKALKKVNTYTQEEILRVEETFGKVMRYCRNIFGRYAFRKISPEGRRGPINKAIFEVWSICFAPLSEEQLQKIQDKKDVFLESFKMLLTDREYASSLRSGKRSDCIRRVNMTREMMEEYL